MSLDGIFKRRGRKSPLSDVKHHSRFTVLHLLWFSNRFRLTGRVMLYIKNKNGTGVSGKNMRFLRK